MLLVFESSVDSGYITRQFSAQFSSGEWVSNIP